MFRRISIRNFKSIVKLDLEELGRINVLIGANGSGKSNLLEAIAFAAAASANKLDHEFLASRGVRAVEPLLMRSAFGDTMGDRVTIEFQTDQGTSWKHDFLVDADGTWVDQSPLLSIRDRPRDVLSVQLLEQFLSGFPTETADQREQIRAFIQSQMALLEAHEAIGQTLRPFLVYSPEYTALRTFRDETQILPLGIQGQGLFAHLKALVRDHPEAVSAITETLGLLDWFDGLVLVEDLAPGERTITVQDRFLRAGIHLDQRSANEGFLFLLFYATLMASPRTPRFFAVDNIDASLNPKLCTWLLRRLVELAPQHDRQLLLTSHNPALLDGLDLNDDNQRLFVISRDSRGRTRARRVEAPKVAGVRLSEAFLHGQLGGLPKNF